MKNVVYMFTILSNFAFGQSPKQFEHEIESYANSIDKLKAENKLVKVFYPNMSGCGGGVYGYFLDKNLVLIDSRYKAELGFSSRTIYIDQDKFLKIIYREHFAEWGKYDKKYPSDKYDYDPTKMTYTDTVYTISLSSPTVFQKQSDNKIISTKLNQSLLDGLLRCAQQMKIELNEVIEQIDSLKYLKEMPYICESGICGDNLYWKAVSIGRSNIELIIDKLDDSTSTTANAVLYGFNYTVADIAFDILTEIIHDIPAFDLLGVSFDKDGCGYCSYWLHLNKDFANRQKFKEQVKNWYHTTKNNLVWVKSNDFATCDCRGQHPNGGHFKVK